MKYKILTNKKIQINNDFEQQLKMILKDHEYCENDYEYIFIIGGDGTFLSYIQEYIEMDVKVVFINSGKLGFYSYINNPKKLLFDEVLKDTFYVNLDVLNITYKDKVYKCINDFAYHSNYTATIHTYINGNILQSIHGNGVLIATPFGSTARNKSLNGAILLPNTDVLTLVEVEPINNRYYYSFNAPIIIKNNNEIKIESSNYNKWWMLIDGKQYESDEPYSTFTINHSKSKCKVLIKTSDADWIRKLNYAFIGRN